VVPAAITKDNPNYIRASGLIVLIPICLGLGLNYLYGFGKYFKSYTLNIFCRSAAYLILITAGINLYQHTKEYIRSESLQSDYTASLMYKACTRLNDYKDKYDRIIIENF